MRRRRVFRYFDNDITADMEDDLDITPEPRRLLKKGPSSRRLPLYEKDGFVVYKETLPGSADIEQYYKYSLINRDKQSISTINLIYGISTQWFWDVRSDDMKYNRHGKYFSYYRGEQAILDYMKDKIEKESATDNNRQSPEK